MRRAAKLTLAVALFALLTVVCHVLTGVARAQTAQPSTYAVIITGLGGDPDYGKMIDGWGKDLHTALEKSGLGKDHLYWLASTKQEEVYAVSQADQIKRLLDMLAARMTPQDAFQLFLIGHGSYDDYDYRFNIPGPDLTAGQISELLARIPCERQLVVNMTSASGASLPLWQKKGRIVITSTSAGQERNFSVFARYFVAALQEPAADADKNESISALETYRYAVREVMRYYESQKRLATEHPLIEDRGEGEGVREATPENGEGLLAMAMALRHMGNAETALDTPQARPLRARKRQAEEAIEQLKYKKASMDTADYMQQLEALLVDLAQVQQQLDALEKK
ncbi:MAG: hypothetical protein HY316_08985 [Acidobacteria bacterium]|nr:hypothetical protein [Acidobacteriota bacterium]